MVKNGVLLDLMKYILLKTSAIDVDVLIDDSPEKLDDFNEKSVNHGYPIV